MKNGISSGQLFWQTTLSIMLGVLTGLLILSFSSKKAQAGFNSTVPSPANASIGPIQILPMLSERMTVLVMGVDSNGRDTQRFVNTRSDSMILVSMDPMAHKVGIVSIPRDSRVQIAGNHGVDKINSAHAFGGAPLAVQTVSENFGVPIDHYVVVDTQALKELCQLLGPVEVLVEKEMHYHDWAAHLHIDLKPGLQTLSPEQVEEYVRFRHDARGDIGRIERQQWFFRAAANKLKDPQFLMHLPDLIRLAHDYVQTDLTVEDMARVATFAKDIKPADVVTAMVPGEPAMINGISYWEPNLDQSHIVFNRILGLSSGGPLVDEPAVALAGTTDGAIDKVDMLTDPKLNPLNKPVSVALKYTKESAEEAAQLETLLTNAGYRVKYKWLMPASECQHEQIIQCSGRADDNATSKMRTTLPELQYWPVVLGLEARPAADFTVVLAPSTQFAVSESIEKQASEKFGTPRKLN